jgi:hypothetical protein
MKNFFIFAILVFISLSSCRKESLIPIDETETEDPKEIEGTFFKGIVKDANGVVAGTKVEVYQHEKLVGSVTTDGTGAFNTLNIPLDKDAHVTFAVKQNNEVTAKRIRENFGKSDIGIITLEENQLFNTKKQYLQNPGSNDLIVVSGYITDPMGNPAIADVVLLYDIIETAPFTYEAQGEGLSTDENGYYELLMPKDQEFYYYVQQSGCNPKVLTADEERIFDGFFPVQVVGPFSSDSVLPLLNNANPQTENAEKLSVSFIVAAATCNGALVENGVVEGTITKGDQIFALEAATVAGFLFYTKTYCIKSANLNAPWQINFKIKDFKNNKISDEKMFEITETDQNLGVVQVCNEIITEKPFVQWNVGQVNYYYEILPGLIDAEGTLHSSGAITSANGLLRFTVPNYTTGGTRMKDFRFLGNVVNQNFSFFQQESDIIDITFESTGDPKIVRGSFEGNLYNSTTEIPLPVKGTFMIKLP